MIDVEICVDSVESSIAAERGGAKRIELYCALAEGGITPSSGLIRSVRKAVALDVFVIIRPRGGNFVYSCAEFEVMRYDIQVAESLGANGVVFGLLTGDHHVDRERTRELADLARPLAVTFHRAFDACANLEQALEDVTWCGADRVLTSGGQPDAMSGAGRIALLQQSGGSRIRIMAGGGLRTSNVARLVQRTGICDVHTSLNHYRAGAEPGMGPTRVVPPYVVTKEDVRSFIAALPSASKGEPGRAT